MTPEVEAALDPIPGAAAAPREPVAGDRVTAGPGAGVAPAARTHSRYSGSIFARASASADTPAPKAE
ncbi:hypothetical protein [Symbioplanes lichenis]|uniref:hypothetical protein n=1 Tax=Symbioplanes lichenis TaxID=1629072 RepID=UPI0027395638|nr:hypothetical protein [Actinoplanes lichenis]